MTHTHIDDLVTFIQRRESSAVKQALAAVTALHDALALKREIRLPVLSESRDAILEPEDQIHSLKTELLRSPQPGQMMFPGMPETWPGVKTRPVEHATL